VRGGMEERDSTETIPPEGGSARNGFLQDFIDEVISSPINILLLAICGFLIYKIYRAYKEEPVVYVPIPSGPPPLPKRDMHLKELRQYDGSGEHGRVCIGCNGKVFDVTRGTRFYGPGGPYAAFAGHDATHALATFNMDDIGNESGDVSGLSRAEMDSVLEWEMQFTEKYEYVGRLLRDEEESATETEPEKEKKEAEKEKKEEVEAQKVEEVRKGEEEKKED